MKNKSKHLFIYFLLSTLFIYTNVRAQVPGNPFPLRLEQLNISGFPGLHSFSWAKWQGKWLIFGGRTNGLHGFQPPFAFPTANQNSTIYVADPDSQLLWSSTAASLPVSIREHVISSNQQFVQRDSFLFITGGYGYASSSNSLITFPYLTRINVPSLIQAIIQQQSITSNFTQIQDQRVAVTGGHMAVEDSVIYLVMGHRFDGRYNPNNGPSFTQTYTDAIRSFTVADSANQLVIRNFTEITDTALYHKRDYNLSPQIFSGNSMGFTAFTGVFQHAVDLPWTTSVDIINGNGSLISNFEQKLNQYHTANTVIYDSINDICYSLFFGGMGMYYPDSLNQLVVDSLVPFVKTISYVQRDASGIIEGWFPVKMNGYEGSSAEFIMSEIPHFSNEVINLHALDTGEITIGYIVGGITSDQPNIFMQGSGTSWASPIIYKVIIEKPAVMGINPVEPSVIDQMRIYPNPFSDTFEIDFKMKSSEKLKIEIRDVQGRAMAATIEKLFREGFHALNFETKEWATGYYTVVISSEGKVILWKSVIKTP